MEQKLRQEAIVHGCVTSDVLDRIECVNTAVLDLRAAAEVRRIQTNVGRARMVGGFVREVLEMTTSSHCFGYLLKRQATRTVRSPRGVRCSSPRRR